MTRQSGRISEPHLRLPGHPLVSYLNGHKRTDSHQTPPLVWDSSDPPHPHLSLLGDSRHCQTTVNMLKEVWRGLLDYRSGQRRRTLAAAGTSTVLFDSARPGAPLVLDKSANHSSVTLPPTVFLPPACLITGRFMYITKTIADTPKEIEMEQWRFCFRAKYVLAPTTNRPAPLSTYIGLFCGWALSRSWKKRCRAT